MPGVARRGALRRGERPEVAQHDPLRLRQRRGLRRKGVPDADPVALGRIPFDPQARDPGTLGQDRAQLGDGQLGEIDWSNDDGDPVFAIEFTRGGVKRSFAVAPDGWLVAREIALEELPVVVRRAVEFELKGVVPKEIQRGDDGLEISYDVTVDVGGQARTLNFSDEGKLTGTQIALNEVPAAALKTLQPRLAGARLVSVSKSVDDDDTYYEAVFVKAGQHHSATVTADGTLASVQLPLAAAPAGVQKTIREQGGFLARLEQVFEDGEEHFQALLRVKGKAVELELKADGSKL